MKTGLFLFSLFISTIAKSQFVPQTQKVYTQTLQSKVLVPLQYSDSVNTRLETAFQKHWRTTPFQIVGERFKDSLAKAKGGAGYTVFEGTLVKTINVRENELGQRSERGTFANWWSYFLMPYDKNGKPDAEAVTAWGPISIYYNEWLDGHPYERTFYRLEFIVKQVNDVLQFIKDNPKGNEDDFKSHINARVVQLKKKTLLVPAELLEKYDIWKIERLKMETGVGKVITTGKPIWKTVVDLSDFADYHGKY